MKIESEPIDWKPVTLYELGEVNRGRSRHRPRYADHLYGGPYPFIQTGDIKSSGGRITEFTQTYSEAGLAQSRLWPEGTMCITIAANIAETAVLTFPACFPDSVVGFIADKTKADVFFVEYMFRHLKTQIQTEASGTVQDNINLATLARLTFPLPPLPEQRAIAHILGTLDDKIELNRRMNRTLEEMARALFQSWFVDFDPVRAKARGEAPPGLAPELAALFPARLVETEVGEAPEGWEVTSILDYSERLSGGTPKTSVQEFWDGDIKWISAKDVKNASGSFAIDTERRITEKGVRQSAAKVLPVNTTIVTARGTVGSYCLLAEEMAINQTNYGLKSKLSVRSDYFVFFSLANLVAWLQQNTHGTIFDTITTDTLRQTKTFLPDLKLVAAFESVVSPVMELMKTNLYQNRTLAELSETLLPKLMSGEVRVPEAAELAGV